MRIRRALAICAVAASVLAGVLVVPDIAEAQVQGARITEPYSGGRRLLQLDVHGGFTWYGTGAATGVRFGIPIVRNGFVRSINNAVYINFGADFYWSWNDRYDEFKAQLEGEGPVVPYFPVWMGMRGYDPRPRITFKPDPGLVTYHWKKTYDPIYVPHPDDAGLRWDLVEWSDSP